MKSKLYIDRGGTGLFNSTLDTTVIPIVKFFVGETRVVPNNSNDINDISKLEFYLSEQRAAWNHQILFDNRTRTHKNGIYKLTGFTKAFNDNGQIYVDMPIVNGKYNGLCKLYSTEYCLCYKFTMKDNMIDGVLYHFNKKGDVYMECNYINDKKHGICKTYKSDKIEECKYETEVSADGNTWTQTMFNNDIEYYIDTNNIKVPCSTKNKFLFPRTNMQIHSCKGVIIEKYKRSFDDYNHEKINMVSKSFYANNRIQYMITYNEETYVSSYDNKYKTRFRDIIHNMSLYESLCNMRKYNEDGTTCLDKKFIKYINKKDNTEFYTYDGNTCYNSDGIIKYDDIKNKSGSCSVQ